MAPPAPDRITIGPLCSPAATLDEDLAIASEAGTALGLALHKLEREGDALEAARRAAEAEVTISHLWVRSPLTLDRPERWPAEREILGLAMDVALAVRPDVVVLTSGSAGTLPWEQAADALEEALRGTVREAEREGIRLALEPTPPQLGDVGFVHTLRDAIELGWRLGTAACLDLDTCWNERNLAGTLTSALDDVALVQVADRPLAVRAIPTRLVPGEGELPLRRLLGSLVDLGYRGWYELELAGDATGDREEAVRRGVTALRGLLDEATGTSAPGDDDETRPEDPDPGDAR